MAILDFLLVVRRMEVEDIIEMRLLIVLVPPVAVSGSLVQIKLTGFSDRIFLVQRRLLIYCLAVCCSLRQLIGLCETGSLPNLISLKGQLICLAGFWVYLVRLVDELWVLVGRIERNCQRVLSRLLRNAHSVSELDVVIVGIDIVVSVMLPLWCSWSLFGNQYLRPASLRLRRTIDWPQVLLQAIILMSFGNNMFNGSCISGYFAPALSLHLSLRRGKARLNVFKQKYLLYGILLVRLVRNHFGTAVHEDSRVFKRVDLARNDLHGIFGSIRHRMNEGLNLPLRVNCNWLCDRLSIRLRVVVIRCKGNTLIMNLLISVLR